MSLFSHDHVSCLQTRLHFQITLPNKNGMRFTRAMNVNIPVELPDVGSVTRIRAELATGSDNWLFDKITLKNCDSGEEYVFVNNEWIEKGNLNRGTIPLRCCITSFPFTLFFVNCYQNLMLSCSIKLICTLSIIVSIEKKISGK